MSRLRIVAGRFGGRRISAPPGESARPTRELVREAWFNALGDRVRGARVVDLFAGSGALGIEALSRGGRSVTFVEAERRTAAILQENLESLEVTDRATLVRRDVGGFLEELPAGETPYDLALADPPYGSGWARRLAARHREAPFAGVLCLEHATGELEDEEAVVWQRAYGATTLTFLAVVDREEDEEA